MENVPASWSPLEYADFPVEIMHQLTLEHPDVALLHAFQVSAYQAQGGAVGTSQELDEFRRWLSYQRMESRSPFPFRKWPRLEAMFYDTFSDKISTVAQRSCRLCRGWALGEEFYKPAFIPIRITPISRQIKKPAIFKAYQSAIASRLEHRKHFLGVAGQICLAITFILNSRARDRDLDNMTKALQDAVARALDFNDKHVHHLDVMKLVFNDTDEFICLKIAPSTLNIHEEVLVKKTAHNWAGWPELKVEDFMPSTPPNP